MRTLKPDVVVDVEVARQLQVGTQVPVHCFTALLLLVGGRVCVSATRMQEMHGDLLRKDEVVAVLATVHQIRPRRVLLAFMPEAVCHEGNPVHLIGGEDVHVVIPRDEVRGDTLNSRVQSHGPRGLLLGAEHLDEVLVSAVLLEAVGEVTAVEHHLDASALELLVRFTEDVGTLRNRGEVGIGDDTDFTLEWELRRQVGVLAVPRRRVREVERLVKLREDEVLVRLADFRDSSFRLPLGQTSDRHDVLELESGIALFEERKHHLCVTLLGHCALLSLLKNYEGLSLWPRYTLATRNVRYACKNPLDTHPASHIGYAMNQACNLERINQFASHLT